MIEEISKALLSLNSKKFRKTVDDALESNLPLKEILEGIRNGMEVVGEKYEDGEFFLAELVMAGHIVKEGIQKLKPILTNKNVEMLGKVVIGTVEGDLHDIGKNIVSYMLLGAGFEVFDLGVDVPREEFVNQVRRVKPDILALSALLSTTMLTMREIIKELKKAGLRDKVKILVGGRPLTEEFAKKMGADAYGKDAVEAVKKAKDLLQSQLTV